MVAPAKTQKEMAYLHEIFVASDWGERFSQLIDEHLKLPTEGEAVYVGVGTGGHALEIHERTGQKLRLLGIDENPESVELARAKAIAVKEAVEFRTAPMENLLTADNQFDIVVANASLISSQRIEDLVTEMVRTAKPNATVALALPTASSFGEFFSVYWEALHTCGLLDQERDVEELITQLPTVSDVEQLAEDNGLEEVTSWTRVEEFDFESGEAFLSAPLISDFLMNHWLESLPQSSQELVSTEIARIINEDRHEAEFALTVKATLIVGRKARDN
jgi:ubiquinone/menaquinone biosynthesis C-methylase UbiE